MCTCVVNCCNKASNIDFSCSFYGFPKDKTLCDKWVEFCENVQLTNGYTESSNYVKNKKICSSHFDDSDFRNIKIKSQGLKKGAIPSQFYPKQTFQKASSEMENFNGDWFCPENIYPKVKTKGKSVDYISKNKASKKLATTYSGADQFQKIKGFCSVIDCDRKRMDNPYYPRTFHEFPKEKERCMKWVEFCENAALEKKYKKGGWTAIKSQKICSGHFAADTYRNPEVKYQGLKPQSVPTTKLAIDYLGAVPIKVPCDKIVDNSIVKNSSKSIFTTIAQDEPLIDDCTIEKIHSKPSSLLTNDQRISNHLHDLSNMCSMCLNMVKTKQHYSVSGKCSGQSIAHMIKLCYSIEISQFPEVTKICEQCLVKLDMVFEIRGEVTRANTKLQGIIDDKKKMAEQAGHNDDHSYALADDPLDLAEGDTELEEYLLEENLSDPTTELMLNVEKLDYEQLSGHSSKNVKKHVKKRVSRLGKVTGLTRKFKCYICNTTFKTASDIRSHFAGNHNMEYSSSCDKCDTDLSYVSAFTFNQHLGHHDEERRFKCTFCWKRFWTETGMQVHEKTHSEDVLECPDTSSEKSAIIRKKRTEKNESCQCVHCGIFFPSVARCKSHEYDEHNFKQKCPECDQVFKSRRRFNLHRRKRKCAFKYVCVECNKGYHSRILYQEHVYKHTGEKPYECRKCHWKFRIHQNYYRHVKLGSCATPRMTYPVMCGVCDSATLTTRTIGAHFKEEHCAEDPQYVCVTCKKSFDKITKFKTHCNVHHDYATNKVVKESTKSAVRKFNCQYCNRGFVDIYSKQRHEKIHEGVKIHCCDLCDKSFVQYGTLQTHRRTHTREKPYKCEECSKMFSDCSSWHKHRKRHQLRSKTNLSPGAKM